MSEEIFISTSASCPLDSATVEIIPVQETVEQRHERFYRKPWMTDDQWECMQMFQILYGGFHHMATDRIKKHGNGICYTEHGTFATYDFNTLTRLVKLAHDLCIRAEILPCNMRYLKVCLYKRKGRSGDIWDRHPTWDQIK